MKIAKRTLATLALAGAAVAVISPGSAFAAPEPPGSGMASLEGLGGLTGALPATSMQGINSSQLDEVKGALGGH
ncbi:MULTISPECIES: hypothetical protein [Streptomyces]|uniref:hypothetical protein n=1 Tax=Streptomyces TaxID=1883 RepID=UPI00240D1B31|nr:MULTISPECIES: hypothetical protein [Streptomyces]WFB83739.1 hypothetical protein MMU79_10670 [Streptomyces olivaceus]WGK50643.1 hypothetical protein M6G09_36335 [Streptomyces sp. B146]